MPISCRAREIQYYTEGENGEYVARLPSTILSTKPDPTKPNPK
jgi:hypothetical protein